jgi:membrane protein implicated in regulation of membrane protease activity
MPLDRFVLILVLVLAAAGATVWVAAMAGAVPHLPGLGLGVASLAALLAYVIVRVIADRVRSEADDRYDRTEP